MQITIPINCEEIIELQENGSTGYVWDFSELEGKITYKTSKEQKEERNEFVCGSGYKLKLYVKSEKTGSFKIFKKRPWESKNSENIETVELVFLDFDNIALDNTEY